MSNNLDPVQLNEQSIQDGGTITANLKYQAANGGKVKVSAKAGFSVTPTHAAPDLPPAGDATVQRVFTIKSTSPGTLPDQCTFNFTLVVDSSEVNSQPADVIVTPAAAASAKGKGP